MYLTLAEKKNGKIVKINMVENSDGFTIYRRNLLNTEEFFRFNKEFLTHISAGIKGQDYLVYGWDISSLSLDEFVLLRWITTVEFCLRGQEAGKFGSDFSLAVEFTMKDHSQSITVAFIRTAGCPERIKKDLLIITELSLLKM